MRKLVPLLAVLGLGIGAAQAQKGTYGSAAEARAMLDKVLVAVKADKGKAIDLFNKGESGFKDRDLQPFCFEADTGRLVAATSATLLGKDIRSLKDKSGKEFGKELFASAVEGRVSEVSYLFPRPGTDDPVPKVSFVTGVGGLGCGVGYHSE
jgi:signal transduction histidine kinase